jgi:hypothetical protein
VEGINPYQGSVSRVDYRSVIDLLAGGSESRPGIAILGHIIAVLEPKL